MDINEINLQHACSGFTEDDYTTLSAAASHMDIEFMDECHNNKILCIYLPPHASQVLQPLDVSVFSPMKAGYKKVYTVNDELRRCATGREAVVFQGYTLARNAALTEHNIRHGFSATGICPINRMKGLSSPFCKAYVPPRPKTPPQQHYSIQRWIQC